MLIIHWLSCRWPSIHQGCIIGWFISHQWIFWLFSGSKARVKPRRSQQVPRVTCSSNYAEFKSFRVSSYVAPTCNPNKKHKQPRCHRCQFNVQQGNHEPTWSPTWCNPACQWIQPQEFHQLDSQHLIKSALQSGFENNSTSKSNCCHCEMVHELQMGQCGHWVKKLL